MKQTLLYAMSHPAPASSVSVTPLSTPSKNRYRGTALLAAAWVRGAGVGLMVLALWLLTAWALGWLS